MEIIKTIIFGLGIAFCTSILLIILYFLLRISVYILGAGLLLIALFLAYDAQSHGIWYEQIFMATLILTCIAIPIIIVGAGFEVFEASDRHTQEIASLTKLLSEYKTEIEELKRKLPNI